MKKYNRTEKILIEAMKEAVQFAKGKKTKAKLHKFESKEEVDNVREKLGITQEEFAAAFMVSVATVRNWEQGRRTPQGPARVLLNVIAKNPKAVFDAIRD